VTSESAAASSPATAPDDDFVEVRLPADGVYLSVLRTASAGLAARLDFTLDEIDDLRIAVDEACAILLAQVVPDGQLTCRFTMGADSLAVAVSAPTREGYAPARDTFAWTVLSALADAVEASVDPERIVTITLHKRRDGGA
jgi:serine/threonine-protein kinase RsbW